MQEEEEEERNGGEDGWCLTFIKGIINSLIMLFHCQYHNDIFVCTIVIFLVLFDSTVNCLWLV